LVDVLTVGGMVLATGSLKMMSVSYFSWIILACETGIICVIISALVNGIFYKEEMRRFIKRVSQRFLWLKIVPKI